MRVAAIIPCYRVKSQVLDVLARVGPEVDAIYVVDDACPEGSGAYVDANCDDPRVQVLRHAHNLGVGGAVKTGYERALADGADVLVKLDGDGQMAPELLPLFVGPIAAGAADYTKGNRFYAPQMLSAMPLARKLGNAALSLLTKLSSGYWHIVDPTNGYTAIHARVLELIPLARVSNDYFFESDLLFRLNIVDAVVCDVPMRAHYGTEKSSLRISRIIPRFMRGHIANAVKRIVYCHFLRGFSVASLEFLAAIPLLVFSAAFGGLKWVESVSQSVPASAGTVMLAAMPALVGLQLLLSFLNYDVSRRPELPRHLLLERLPLAFAEQQRSVGPSTATTSPPAMPALTTRSLCESASVQDETRAADVVERNPG